ncbi:HNH endonuclease family protein [Pseudonocardia hispaniensis]|uniref:HNH endonuclease family protein n=1 Tax=Pseudonocardia hispaniensis TaxID=904933 RepID=A0ABW1J947_9PSEU
MRATGGTRFRRTWRVALAILTAGALSSGCAALELLDVGAPAPTGEAATALDTLAVKGRAPKTGYDREQFGPAWADVDNNGCDTRNDILRRDLSGAELKPAPRPCIVLAGLLADPYSGEDILFHRGKDTSAAVQIDHVVALSDAWQKGAQQLTAQQRRDLANDPLNLLAVSGRLNQQKSDSDAASWLPPNNRYRCAYVARQVAVKAKYQLWVTEAERDAIAGVLEHCPGEPLPTDATIRPVA